MKRVELVKYGFVRTPEDDFTDDSTRFQVFRVSKNIRVSKTTYLGDVFLSARYEGGELEYKEYSKLPHYQELDRLNGYCIGLLTEDDIQRLYEACLAYEKEYEEAVSKIVYPTKAELEEKCKKVQALRLQEAKECEKLIQDNAIKIFVKLSKYALEDLKNRLTSLMRLVSNYDYSVYVPMILNKPESRRFMENTDLLNESWYSKQAKEIICGNLCI